MGDKNILITISAPTPTYEEILKYLKESQLWNHRPSEVSSNLHFFFHEDDYVMLKKNAFYNAENVNHCLKLIALFEKRTEFEVLKDILK